MAEKKKKKVLAYLFILKSVSNVSIQSLFAVFETPIAGSTSTMSVLFLLCCS